MKAIILAGGLGTRISEETIVKPKPMVLINQKPILMHIINIFSGQNIRDFVIATGYKNTVIDDYFSEIALKAEKNEKLQHNIYTLTNGITVETIFTGMESQTGHRVRMCLEFIKDDQVFLTYGDGLANIDLKELLSVHNREGKLATVSAVRPPARFGLLDLMGNSVLNFSEKDQLQEGWINGGFFVLENRLKMNIIGANPSFESDILPALASNNDLAAYKHEGFWKPMDTLRERNELEELAKDINPPWYLI